MSRAAFFRQSGWMVFASVVGGLCLFGVHPFSQKIPDSEYGILVTLLAVLNCMSIPALGLQMVFVQQTAAVLDETDKRKLRGTTRGVLGGTLVIWIVMAAAALLLRNAVIERWHLSNPAALWLTILIGLAALWQPVFAGILQGKQNFFWVGWAAILGGFGRLVGVAVIVLVFGGYAAGMVVGILLGMAAGLAIFVWHTRDVWLGPRDPFEWRPWLARVVPLTFGFGAFQFMWSADPLFVQAYFDPDTTGFYGAAGTMSRALVAFTGPVVAVMFPKIVHSVAKSEHTDVTTLTLITTAVLAGFGALALSVIAPYLMEIVFKDTYADAAGPLLRRFAWSMVPLAMANVLVNNLLARAQFRVVPWLVLVALAYGLTLRFYHPSFLSVIYTLGAYNLAFLGVAWLFTRGNPKAKSPVLRLD